MTLLMISDFMPKGRAMPFLPTTDPATPAENRFGYFNHETRIPTRETLDQKTK
jgi:hypothetical protein